MSQYLANDIPVIGDDADVAKFLQEAKTRGMGTGNKPRDYTKHPEGCFAFAEPFPDSMLIPMNNLEARLKEQQERKASLLDIRAADYEILKSLYQNGFGLCWQFSGVKAMMYCRAIANLPGVRLSAYWAAGQVKRWADQGGWGSEGLQQLVEKGAPEEKFCPEYKRQYDTPEARENALKYRVTEWWEGSSDKEKATHQMVTAQILGLPCIADFNHISHSMCVPHLESIKVQGGRIVTLKTAADNSWGESSGDRGLYALENFKAKPDGLWIPRVALPGGPS